ncbi:unnamed protein product, partial [Durusdinium trenchii]
KLNLRAARYDLNMGEEYNFDTTPWLHMFSLQSKIRQSDRDQQKWSSEGNTKVKQ